MFQTNNHFRIAIYEKLLPYFNLNFRSQALTHHISFILLFSFLEFSVFPTIVPPSLHIDLLTTWLVLISISQNHLKALLLGALICMTKESHFIVPAGYFFVPYTTIVCSIFLVREHISWQKNISWFFMVFAGQFVISVFHLVLSTPINQFIEFSYFKNLSIQFILSTSLGLLIVFYIKNQKLYGAR
tara:strand:+ start:274 stop:831 length:558 start_codon:yes stop_codon:yes gene_type:complete